MVIDYYFKIKDKRYKYNKLFYFDFKPGPTTIFFFFFFFARNENPKWIIEIAVILEYTIKFARYTLRVQIIFKFFLKKYKKYNFFL
jgi:hypothetical protein